MQHETFRTDLGGVRVVAVQFTVDGTGHHRLIDPEGPGGENALAFFVCSPESEAVNHRLMNS
ncbi:hypothetical protein [Streptomyces sp. NBC_00154]|uniref:hypothetical protein n=1 Tax=Streptomyces sp. NBC_00154 TaxID=2975670 RepID=UPI002250AF16|nr:hypothetical protein [Streptomyces sp. NBC_00154]MCX5315959.1 hypothetical protein [Streptomyces sp. NBC_00154]